LHNGEIKNLTIKNMYIILADLFIEATMVGIICGIFLILFVVAGIRQILRDRDEM
jgi:hypothetical protein